MTHSGSSFMVQVDDESNQLTIDDGLLKLSLFFDDEVFTMQPMCGLPIEQLKSDRRRSRRRPQTPEVCPGLLCW
jgi:hypothetical protein